MGWKDGRLSAPLKVCVVIRCMMVDFRYEVRFRKGKSVSLQSLFYLNGRYFVGLCDE